MKTLKITDIRKIAKEHDWPDSWWYCKEETVSEEPIKIGSVPRDGTVHVKNVQDTSEDWIRFRYPGYVTPEEIEEKREAERRWEEAERQRNLPSEKQKVALEFFGKKSCNVTRQEANELLDELFDSDWSRHEYSEFKWKHRHRIYDTKELLKQSIYRHQMTTCMLTERIADSKVEEAISRAIQEYIQEDDFIDFLKKNYANFFLSENSRRRKLKELNESIEAEREFYKSESKKGCLSCILFTTIGALTLILLAKWV